MERKLRVLWCGEASFLNTGYSVYAKELLNRLHSSNKYEIAELGCYAAHDDPNIYEVPWRFYPTLPINDSERNIYASSPNAQFGEWRFDEICLDFKPDVVIDIRDWWMMEYQDRSPFRQFFKWAIMPTVDSEPQQEQYISTYMNADAVFTYSEFGKRVLEGDSNNNINVLDICSPAANFDFLKPSSNKKQHKKMFGFLDDVTLVGTVMRNQRRKLYPNLISTFRKLLDEDAGLQKNTFLYIHSSYPDVGWDLPYFLKRYNMGNHTLFTYKCKSCGSFFPSFFQGSLIPCARCGQKTAVMPNTNFGVTTEELGQIINCFDLYVQYSVCEGFGMPQVEAAACGVPVISVDYSAMESVGKNIKADMVKNKDFFWDLNTHSQRSIPDDEDLLEKMKKFIKLPQSMKSKKGMDAYMGVKKNYSWDKCAKSWEKYLDSVEIKDEKETWLSEPKTIDIPSEIPANFDNEQIIDWSVQNILGGKQYIDDYVCLRILRDLNSGQSMSGHFGLYYNEFSSFDNNLASTAFTQQEAVRNLIEIRQKINSAEEIRAHMIACKNDEWKSEFLMGVKP
tara:strand:+ start:545 stop:2236 length:1692 start_codon:yes stop_codon:yes gene_type:complete